MHSVALLLLLAQAHTLAVMLPRILNGQGFLRLLEAPVLILDSVWTLDSV